MFTVIYRFTVAPGKEQEFLEAWEQLTTLIYRFEGSLGSRLHRNPDDPLRYIAYAQWPSESRWKSAGDRLPEEAKRWRTQMREACEEVETLYKLNVENDLLSDKTFTTPN